MKMWGKKKVILQILEEEISLKKKAKNAFPDGNN